MRCAAVVYMRGRGWLALSTLSLSLRREYIPRVSFIDEVRGSFDPPGAQKLPSYLLAASLSPIPNPNVQFRDKRSA